MCYKYKKVPHSELFSQNGGHLEQKNLEEQEFLLIISSLKSILKQKKITYQNLAKGSDISISSLKKVFAGRDISLKKLITICKAIDISFLELLEIAKQTKSESIFRFDETMEDFFVKNTTYFLFFHKVYHEKKQVDEVRNELGLDSKAVKKIIDKLISMKLVRAYNNDKLVFNIEGGVRYRDSGALSSLIMERSAKGLIDFLIKSPDSEDLLKDPFLRLNFSFMTAVTFKKLVAALSQVHTEFAAQSIRDRRSSKKQDLIAASWVMGLGPCNAINFLNRSLI